MSRKQCLTAFGGATLAAAIAAATSIIPPADLGELASIADDVALAVAGSSRVSQHGLLPFTVTTFLTLAPVSGSLARGVRFTVEVPGGTTETAMWLVPGSPRFEPGHAYLLFLHERGDGVFVPQVAAYGLLHRVVGRDGSALLAPLPEQGGIEVVAVPRSGGVEPIGTYEEVPLLDHLRGVIAHRETWTADAVTARPEQLPLGAGAENPPSGCAFETGTFKGTTLPLRWHAFETGQNATVYYGGSPPAGDSSRLDGGVPELQNAVAMWAGVPGTNIDLVYGGGHLYTMTCTSRTDMPGPGDDYVMFDDPCGDIAPLAGTPSCAGELAFGGSIYMSTPNTLSTDSSSWWTIVSLSIVVNKGIGTCLSDLGYQNMLAHELGHGLGFGHVSDPNSLMYSMCDTNTCNGIDSTDVTCAQYVYPAAVPTPTPTPPAFAVSFVYAPAAPYQGASIQFTDTSSGATSWLWTFGDAASSHDRSPAHVFAARGVFTVTLSASNGTETLDSSASVTVDSRLRRRIR